MCPAKAAMCLLFSATQASNSSGLMSSSVDIPVLGTTG